MEPSASPAPEEKPLVETKKIGAPRIVLATLVAIIVILAGALAFVEFYHPAIPPTPTGILSVQSTSPTAQQGSVLRFTLSNLSSNAHAVVHMGDGQIENTTTPTFTHKYDLPGAYLVYAEEFGNANGTAFANTANALISVTVVPSIPFQLSQYLSVPQIYFNKSLSGNTNAPIFAAGTQASLFGAYGEASQLRDTKESFWNKTLNQYNNITDIVSLDHYTWDFGNGKATDVQPDPDTLLPATNPVNQAYSNAGLYTVLLTLWTTETLTAQWHDVATNTSFTNTTTVNTYSVTVGQTLAVGSWSFQTTSGNVPNPGVITEIVNSPGGPFSFDPQIDYETTGFEVVVNTQATLLIYNSSSTTSWFPYVADSVPTVGNGVSSDFKTYTFHIRPGMGFSNGDPITAYDVWYTMIRAILFQGGYPGDADWILCKYLFPVGTPPLNFQPFVSIVNDTNKAVAFSAIVNAVSYNNDSQTVTFHLAIAKSPAEFFTSINDALGTGILDAAWLKSVGAGITFTPDGFLAYQDQANEGSYNLQVQYHPVASGPFEINTYVPATAVVLTPNPYFPGIPAIPKQDKTVILKWVSSPAVAYQLFASGQGDIVTLLPPPYYKTINTGLVPNQAHIEGPFPTITEFFVVFNVNIATSLISTDIGPGYSIPSDYFANPLVREAFAYAFNYTQYVDQILGNKKYGFNFGSPYCGVIVKGLPYYVPPTGLPGCPTYDLAKAKSLLYQSGEYNTSVKIPIVVPTGDDTDFLAAQVLSAALAFIDSNIVMTPVSITFHNIIGYSTPGANPMPIYFLGWIADYPYPSDYTDAMYLEKGTYPGPNGWDQTYLNGLAAAHPTEAALYRAQASAFANLTANITAADTATSAATAAADYAVAEQWGVLLYMYVYTYQATGFWITSTFIHPHNNDWGFQENPTIGAGADSAFFWWTKG
ncbi:MAG: ABC transporter substrate-binding protein [Methanobacteriota archaeon]|nr:MAG: ABC transporter substrate-binding protein [Euryarchaeota archaeon]